MDYNVQKNVTIYEAIGVLQDYNSIDDQSSNSSPLLDTGSSTWAT